MFSGFCPLSIMTCKLQSSCLPLCELLGSEPSAIKLAGKLAGETRGGSGGILRKEAA